MVRRKEYKFTYSTGLFYSRPKGDDSSKHVKRIKSSSLPKSLRTRVIKNAGTWT